MKHEDSQAGAWANRDIAFVVYGLCLERRWDVAFRLVLQPQILVFHADDVVQLCSDQLVAMQLRR